LRVFQCLLFFFLERRKISIYIQASKRATGRVRCKPHH
jgi:hypothetical protein